MDQGPTLKLFPLGFRVSGFQDPETQKSQKVRLSSCLGFSCLGFSCLLAYGAPAFSRVSRMLPSF